MQETLGYANTLDNKRPLGFIASCGSGFYNERKEESDEISVPGEQKKLRKDQNRKSDLS